MKNNYLWGILVLVGIVFAGLLISVGTDIPQVADVSTSTPAKTTTTSPTKTKASAAPVSGMQTSLGGVFAIKGNYQCDYESVTSSTRTSNVVYLSDGKMRGEFRTVEAGMSKATIAVYDGSYLYIWTEGQSTGTLSQPKTLADLPGLIPEDVSSGRILGAGLNSVSWNCHPWSKDASLLARPSYVTFN